MPLNVEFSSADGACADRIVIYFVKDNNLFVIFRQLLERVNNTPGLSVNVADFGLFRHTGENRGVWLDPAQPLTSYGLKDNVRQRLGVINGHCAFAVPMGIVFHAYFCIYD